MAEIKVTVDEKEYTKEQFKKDLVRMRNQKEKNKNDDKIKDGIKKNS